MSFSNFLENALLDEVLGAANYTPAATVYIALSTATIDDTTTGSTIVEPSGGSYARVAVTNNATNWPNASGGVKSNGTEIAFPQATANWGTITHWAVIDAATNGNILAHGELNTPTAVNTNDTFKFPVGNLTFTLD